jgi:hypothetical protein
MVEIREVCGRDSAINHLRGLTAIWGKRKWQLDKNKTTNSLSAEILDVPSLLVQQRAQRRDKLAKYPANFDHNPNPNPSPQKVAFNIASVDVAGHVP